MDAHERAANSTEAIAECTLPENEAKMHVPRHPRADSRISLFYFGSFLSCPKNDRFDYKKIKEDVKFDTIQIQTMQKRIGFASEK